MISFQGFKPSGIEKIANAMGFQGEEKDFQKFLETATTSLNVYLYAPEKEEDMDIAWLLAIAKIADYTILDLDYMEISDKKFASYILSIPNTFYLTKDDVTPYNKINLNRVYDLNWLGDITIENEK